MLMDFALDELGKVQAALLVPFLPAASNTKLAALDTRHD